MRGRRNIKLVKPPSGRKLLEKNPLNEYTPGFFIPVYSSNKKATPKEKEDEQFFEITNHVDRKTFARQKERQKAELALSECSYRVMNRNKFCVRQLQMKMEDLQLTEQKWRQDSEVTKLLLHSEHTLLTKRVTKPLDELHIPEWRYTDICKCHTSNRHTCPRHWRLYEKEKQDDLKEHTMFGLKTESEEQLYESFPITRIAKPRRKKLKTPELKEVAYLT